MGFPARQQACRAQLPVGCSNTWMAQESHSATAGGQWRAWKDADASEYVHFALDRRKERLQPFIRGGVRKVASEDLWRTLSMSGACHVRDGKGRTLKPGVSSTTASCAAGGTPFSVTGAAGASDILRGVDGGGLVGFREDELVEPVSSCQTWGLRRKHDCEQMPCFDTSGKLRS